MLTMETKTLDISDILKRKIEMIGRFTNTKPKLQNDLKTQTLLL